MMNKFMLFIRIAATTPILLLAAALSMLLVAGFDEGFKPCPNYKRVETKCTSSKSTSSSTCYTLVGYQNFCGQTMHPRATTCCRVPCLQNFTTYFDSKGNADDCYTQAFVAMSVPIGGFALLGVSLFWLLCLCAMTKLFPQYCNVNYIVRGIDAAQPSAIGGKSTPDTIDDQVSHERSHKSSGDVEQVQIV